MKEIRFILPDQAVDSIKEILVRAGLIEMDCTEESWHRQVLLDRIEMEMNSNLLGKEKPLGVILVSTD